MPIIPLDTIHLKPGRIRTEFDGEAIHRLANVILEDGLLHAPTVDKEGNLLAGERRLRAITLLSKQGLGFMWANKRIEPGECPVEVFHSTEELILLRAELRENTERSDITWKEKVAATERLLRLQGIEREIRGEPALPERMMIRELATELGKEKKKSVPSYVTNKTHEITRDNLLAAWLDDPEVSAAKTANEAYKIVEAKLVEAKRKALSREFKTAAPVMRHTLIHGDANIELAKLSKNTFDVIITDPPYGVNIDGYASLQGGVDHHYDDSPQVLEELLHTFSTEFFRVTKPEAHLYMFCDYTWFEIIRAKLYPLWYVWPRPLIWHRSDSTGMLPRPQHGPRRNYECILYAIKGDKRVQFVGNDVISLPSDKGLTETTAARKPVDLYVELLRRSVVPGNQILDSCAGSGPVFDAAERLECIATGIELNEALVGVCSERLRNIAKRAGL
jgi:site-specific DNA-methyltransferase (adenine-specific)